MPKVSEEYKSLFHYTTYPGLMGILESQSLWATHYRYLNDTEELTHAKRILYSILLPRVRNVIEEGSKRNSKLHELTETLEGAAKFAEREAHAFVDILYNPLLKDDKNSEGLQGPFILAFCAEKNEFTNKNGLLSQWRAYGEDGGYCIEFDAKGLEDLLEEEFTEYYYPISIFADVGYGTDLKKVPEDFKDNVQKLENLFTGFIENLRDSAAASNFIKQALGSFVNVISRSKHIGFEEEKEVRAVSFSGTEALKQDESDPIVRGRRIKQIHFRSNLGTPLPYIKLFEDKKKLPITKIIVGPHKNKALRKQAIEAMVKGSNIGVTVSEIPFLGF